MLFKEENFEINKNDIHNESYNISDDLDNTISCHNCENIFDFEMEELKKEQVVYCKICKKPLFKVVFVQDWQKFAIIPLYNGII